MCLGKAFRIGGLALIAMVACLAVAAVIYLRLPWITSETVHFESGGVTLVGTLALPRWHDGPYPAAVVVQGSGNIPRWINWFTTMRLVPHGMAALIYDKRGVGDSSGSSPQSIIGNAPPFNMAACGEMLDLLARDALAGVEWLKTRDDIDSTRIGFVGASQAGWIMPLAASRADDVAFIVSISGPAVSCGLEDWYSQLTGEYGPNPEGELSDEEIERRLREYGGPDGYDPLPVLATLQVPTLWVLGGRDRSVPTSWSVANLEPLIAEGAPFDLQIYREGDHMLRRPNSQRRFDYWSDVRAWLLAKGLLTP